MAPGLDSLLPNNQDIERERGITHLVSTLASVGTFPGSKQSSDSVQLMRACGTVYPPRFLIYHVP